MFIISPVASCYFDIFLDTFLDFWNAMEYIPHFVEVQC